MPRACVIVLDAVGAGELPDAAEYGDEGSNTLGNVARAVGGLDLPASRRSGSATSCRWRAARRSRGRRRWRAGSSSARRGRTRRRALGADGRRHATAMPTYPHGFPHDVIDPFMHRTGRGVLGNKAASGTEIIAGAGRGAPGDREVDRLHVCGLRLPDRRARGDDPLEELYDACRMRARSSPASTRSDA